MVKKSDNRNLAGYIDHTLLRPDATSEDIGRLCGEAKRHGFAAVCVNPCWVELCGTLLWGTDVRVCTVIGFPLGANSTRIKAAEAERAIRDGARELDMVMNVGFFKKTGYPPPIKAKFLEDIAAVRQVIDGAKVNRGPVILKVIIETHLLTKDEIVRASQWAEDAGAHFIKTCTGFGGGATVEDVTLIRQAVRPETGVKASDGIHAAEEAWALIGAGADRIGTSAGVAIAQGKRGRSDY